MLLQKLNYYLLKNKVYKYKIIVASADSVNNLLQQIKQIIIENSLSEDDFEYFGRENIHKINEISIPIIA